ncbi:hypothetical protein H6F89_24835 [Cyanobacteria bacterium FACHB-63]|nr:hypothetical protein [Cyanobacteria bacterium FACHB-63]
MKKASFQNSGSNCSYAAPQRSVQGLNFMVINDRIARIDVRRFSLITTLI